MTRSRASANPTAAYRAEVPGLRTTRVLLLLPLIALLYFAGWNSAGNAQTSAVPSYDHIFFVIDENHSRSQVIGPAPYLTGLANAGAQSTQQLAVSHPSLPNYLSLADGTTHGVTDDGTGYVFNTNNIAHEISGSGRSWKGYMEGLPSPCSNVSGSGGYAKKHDPFMYESNITTVPSECNRVVPFTQLATDLSSTATTPNFAWITPNLNNDMHDGSVAQGDAWAQANFPAIFNSPAWKTQHSLFVFTTDEDGGGANNVPFFALSSDGTTKANFVSTVQGTHYSWLRTIEAAWGLGQMTSNDAAASPMTDLFTGSPAPSPSPTPTTGVLSGTVTNASGGAAIAGATVRDGGSTSTTTNASGGYSLSGLAPGTHTLNVAATGFNPGTQTAMVTAGTTSSVNLTLTALPGSVQGSVTNASGGVALAGATVRDSGGPSASTDASGAYTLSGLSAGSHTLNASASGFNSQAKTATVAAGQTTLNVTFSLTPVSTTGGITGKVTSTVGGAAVSGAAVHDSGGASATTDGAGSYSFPSLNPGSHTLTTSAAGFASMTQTASVTVGTTQNVSFSLTPLPTTGVLTGTVTSASGGGITGATVTDGAGPSATTDTSGAYTLSGLTAGSHTLTASVTGFASVTQTTSITAGATQNLNFSLTPMPTTGAVTGAVTSASGGAAIAGATIADSGGASAITDASGAYTLAGLTGGSHSLTASASGFTVQTQSASVTAGNTTQNVSFSLVPVASSGTPALVQVSGATESGASTSLTATFSSSTTAGHLLVLSASVYTGATNHITSVTDPAGNAWTRIGAFGSAGHYSDGEMWFAAAAGATKIVTVHMANPAVASVAIQEFSGVAASSPVTASTGASSTALSAASGSLTPTVAGDLAVGFIAGHTNSQAISISSSGYSAQGQQTSTVGTAVASVVTGFKVLSSSTPETYAGSFASSMYWAAGIVDFKAATGAAPAPMGSIAGTVSSASGGTAVSGATVSDSGGATATTDGSGSYSLTGLKPGTHTLTASANGFTAGTQTAAVTAGGNQSLTFLLSPRPTTGAVDGTVTSSSGGTMIASATVSDNGGASVTTTGSGLYTLAGLAPGSHTLTAAAGGYAPATLTAMVIIGQTTQNVSFSLTPTPPPGDAPIRATFLYDWYPETWNQGSNYMPAVGHYASADPALLRTQVASMLYANITTGINSWFGPGTITDSRIGAQLAADHGTAFTTSLYYESEGYVDPSATQIGSDMDYAAKYFADPSYLHINGKPVVFVYADGADNCGMAQRWAQGTAGKNVYVVLKVFPGYLACADQPSSWHQYSPAVREDRQGKFSTAISPSFWKWGEAAPRLTRDPVAFAAAVRDMVASGAQWQLVISFNEYVEGTQIESTTDMPTCAGQGVFLTILHRDGNPGPC